MKVSNGSDCGSKLLGMLKIGSFQAISTYKIGGGGGESKKRLLNSVLLQLPPHPLKLVSDNDWWMTDLLFLPAIL